MNNDFSKLPTVLIAVDPGLRAGAMVFQYIDTAAVLKKTTADAPLPWPPYVYDHIDDIAVDAANELALVWYKNFDAADLVRFHCVYEMVNSVIADSCCAIHQVVLAIERPGHVRGHARKLIGIYWAVQLAVVQAIQHSSMMHTVDTEPDIATILQIAPGTLKKFISGNGRCPKAEIIAHVQRKWSDDYSTFYDGTIMNDQMADAYGLYRMANAWMKKGDGCLQYEQDALGGIEVVEWGKIDATKS